MKKLLFVFLLLFSMGGFLAADVHFKFYPGLYVGGNSPAEDGLSVGADIQLGIEFGDFDYDFIVFGIHGNVGIDTGMPNHPNFYYGGVLELYFGEEEIKVGLFAGIGGNRGTDTGERNLETVFFRLGLPLNFFGKFKISACVDLYPDIGCRLGMMMHLGIGG